MPPALPGFYYDAEKKKYFKIQPNHVAAHGSASKYTKAAVTNEAEEQRERKRRKVFEEKESKTRIRRSRVLESPLSGGWGITRELGIGRSASGAAVMMMMMRVWAQGLRGEEVASFRRHGDGGSGVFVLDADVGILTYAETLGGRGGSALFSVFVGSIFLPGFEFAGRDADDDDGLF